MLLFIIKQGFFKKNESEIEIDEKYKVHICSSRNSSGNQSINSWISFCIYNANKDVEPTGYGKLD